MSVLQGEKIAQAILDHQTSPVTGWAYGELVEELHRWCDRVDKDFDLAIPTPVIAIAPLRLDVLGLYRLGRNEIGTRTTIYLM